MSIFIAILGLALLILVPEAPARAGSVDLVKPLLEVEDFAGTSGELDELEQALREQSLSPGARTAADKGLTELRDALGSDAYWKAPIWKRLVAIGGRKRKRLKASHRQTLH